MLAEDKLRQGDVVGALAELKSAVQQNPADPKYRAFLFQLFAVAGKWESALNQLEVAGELDVGMLAMVQAYREAIRCEQERERVFAGTVSPLIFGEPDRWLALLIQSLKLGTAGQQSEAMRLRLDALESAPATAGTLTVNDGVTADFVWIADADSRLGPVLEVFLGGKYFWIPFNRISQIDFEPPADLRDFVWTAAHFTWSNGGQAVGMIPTRYPGSASSTDPLIQLARKTEWIPEDFEDEDSQANGEMASGDRGQGQRMFATDDCDYALLDIRKIVLESDSADNG